MDLSQPPEMVADVLLLLPLARTYTYSIPPVLAGKVRRGVQVSCPVRGRRSHGVVIAVRESRPGDPALHPLSGVVATRPPWPDDLLALLDWAASYYVAPVGQVARTAMPTFFAVHSPKPTQYLRIASYPIPSLRSRKALAILAAIEEAGTLEMGRARDMVRDGAAVVKRLIREGLVVVEEEAVPQRMTPPGRIEVDMSERHDLTAGQTEALGRIVAALGKGFSAFLLHGVTGSGKTEVYMRVIEEVARAGKGAIVLVPEIALTVDLRRRFEARFGDRIAILHSAMPPARRAAAWDAVLAGRIGIVVGARSAVFAPVADLGLVVVDEEHEPTYKQEEGLRYNARDLALVRGKLSRCPVVLGSATPSLESFQNAHASRFTYLNMPRRVMERTLPSVRFVDLRYEGVKGEERMFSEPLLAALRGTLDRGESAMLYLNRRGFGRFQVCRTCGGQVQCPNCTITLVHHIRPDRLACHYCDHEEPVPGRCPACGGSDLAIVGFGTERVEEEVARLIPPARCGRLDADTSRGGGLDRILASFRSGEINTLIGTQIIAKGHDFPMVTLVGVLLAEQSLAFPDFRSAERTFQIMTQVAGRSGRGDLPGQVIIQTYCPEHYALRFAATHDFLGFVVTENQMRRARGYPPHSHLAEIEVSSPDPVEAARVAEETRDFVTQFLMAEGARPGDVRVLGPAKAALERLRGRSRMHILLKARSRGVLNRVLWRLYRLVGRGHGHTRIEIDVDPVGML